MNLTIKDLPAAIHGKLKARAESNKRSLNWEVIDILEKAVEVKPTDVDELLAEMQRLRQSTKGPPLTEELLRKAKNQGRR